MLSTKYGSVICFEIIIEAHYTIYKKGYDIYKEGPLGGPSLLGSYFIVCV